MKHKNTLATPKKPTAFEVLCQLHDEIVLALDADDDAEMRGMMESALTLTKDLLERWR